VLTGLIFPEEFHQELIRPDFPELLDWPYLWQQQEYVIGGGATNFMFLVLAADQLLTGQSEK
jgi:hypothetical protein